MGFFQLNYPWRQDILEGLKEKVVQLTKQHSNILDKVGEHSTSLASLNSYARHMKKIYSSEQKL